MTTGTCAVVWIDADHARILLLDADDAAQGTAETGGVRIHRRSRVVSPHHRRATEDHVFYQKIANDLASVRKFLVLAPADEKARFVKHLHRYDPRLIVRLNAIEATEQPADDELLATARVYFEHTDLPMHAPIYWSI